MQNIEIVPVSEYLVAIKDAYGILGYCVSTNLRLKKIKLTKK